MGQKESKSFCVRNHLFQFKTEEKPESFGYFHSSIFSLFHYLFLRYFFIILFILFILFFLAVSMNSEIENFSISFTLVDDYLEV